MVMEACRSKSPDGIPCAKPRGHKSGWHDVDHKAHPEALRRWSGGIKAKARWEDLDAGYMSEADWQTWGRGVRF